MSSFGATFSAAVRSVGTAATMASVGFYMHRRDFVTPEGKRTLALLSQQITIPALLFTKIVYCPQNTDAPCPSIMRNLGNVRMLLWWPLFVVGCGLLVGRAAAALSGAPKGQVRSALAACAFANSTGLPITLLTVVRANFPATSELGRVDPMLFLSVYLLLYPVLQWGVGGWLLAPGDGDEDIAEGNAESRDEPFCIRHVLNAEMSGGIERRHSSAAEMLVRELSFQSEDLEMQVSGEEHDGKGERNKHDEDGGACDEMTKLVPRVTPSGEATGAKCSPAPASPPKGPVDDVVPFMETMSRVAGRCLQPPVVGALLGMLVASTPTLRGIFVDLYDRDDDAPLEWLFDGMYAVGQAAVPVNMTILGINLSKALEGSSSGGSNRGEGMMSARTMAAVVLGKMAFMPAIGVASAVILKNYVWNVPHDIDGSFYLVLMIVFITPTANNVMVMVELGGGKGSKEGMARLIGWQYAVAPVLLSVSVAVVVAVASRW